MPEIALPFALVGAAAGWLSSRLLVNPLLGLACFSEPELAALCGLVAGMGAGALLTRRCAPRSIWSTSGEMFVWVVLSVGAAGALAGGALGAIWWRTFAGALSCGVAGIGCGLAFLPVCALVVAAGRRAARARLGSLVAASDRRAMWGTMAAALAVTTMAALPDWPAASDGIVTRPWAAAVMALLAAATGAILLGFDAAAWFALRRIELARSTMLPQASEDDDRHAPLALHETDVGLGEERAVEMARLGAAYRSKERIVARIVGSPARCRDALRTALATNGSAFLLGAAALGLHALATGPIARLAYEESRCGPYLEIFCTAAATRLRIGDGVKAEPKRAVSLYERACHGKNPDPRGCASIAEMLEGEELDGPDTSRAGPYRERACEVGDGPSCRVRALELLRSEMPFRDQPEAARLLYRACARRDRASCDDAPIVEMAFDRSTRALGLMASCLRGTRTDCAAAADFQAAAPSIAARLEERGKTPN